MDLDTINLNKTHFEYTTMLKSNQQFFRLEEDGDIVKYLKHLFWSNFKDYVRKHVTE